MIVPGCTIDIEQIGQCPEPGLLCRFLQLQLGPEQRLAVRQHVDQCQTCQATLDRLAAGDSDPKLLSSSGLNRPAAESLPALVENLCRALQIEPPEHDRRTAPINLEPCDEGYSLGRLNRYLIVRELAQGASGTVFEALDPESQTAVAIKYIRSTNESVLRRVEREARAISQVQHAHVVSIRAVETSSDGHLFLVMPLALGRSLSELIQDTQGLPFEKSVAIILQIAQGLQAVHDQGLIHRDVKPGNIVVDPTGHACLTDFGLASFVDEESSLTATDVVIGTPAYMSPEQARNAPDLDARSDLYSLGATFYECLTGVRPFRGPLHQVLQNLQTSDPVRPRAINPQIPAGLEAICLQTLERQPHRRYSSMASLIGDLQAWQAGRSVRARLPSGWSQLRKWLTRDIRLTTALAAILLTLAVGIAAAWHYSDQAATQSRIAQSRFDASLQTINLLAELTRQTLNGDPGLAAVRRQVQVMADQAFAPLIQQRPTDPENLLRYLQAMDNLGLIKHTVAGPAEALEFRKQMIADHREALTNRKVSDDLRRTWASLNHRLAVGYVEIRDYEAASRALDEAYTSVDVDDPLDHLVVASLEHSRGTVAYWKDNDLAVATRHFRDSVQFAESYQKQNPADRMATATRCNTLGWLANCESAQGNGELAEQMLRELWNEYAELAAGPDANYQNRLDQNRAALSLLHVLITRGETERAVQWGLEHAADFNALVAANPNLMEPAALQIGFGCEMAGAELAQGDFVAAAARAEELLKAATELDQRFPSTTRAWQQLGFARQTWATCALNRGDYDNLVPFLTRWIDIIDNEIEQGLNAGFNQQVRLSVKTTLARVLDDHGNRENAALIWDQVLTDSPPALQPGLQWLSQLTRCRSLLREGAKLTITLDSGFEPAMAAMQQFMAALPNHPASNHLKAEHHALAWLYLLQELPPASASQGATPDDLQRHLELAQQALRAAHRGKFYDHANRLANFRNDPLFAAAELQSCIPD